MSIDLYSGTPGSGKSLRACYKIISRLKSKRDVIANFSINFDYFKKKKIGKFTFKQNENMTVNFLLDYAEKNHVKGKEHQTLIVLDECGMMFNSRDYAKKDRMGWIVFFQQHRKLGYDVILISQQDRMIDRQIRGFIETEYKHRNIKNYKTFGWLLSLFSGGFFIAVEVWYGTSLKCGSEFFRYDKRKATIYDTYQIFE